VIVVQACCVELPVSDVVDADVDDELQAAMVSAVTSAAAAAEDLRAVKRTGAAL